MKRTWKRRSVGPDAVRNALDRSGGNISQAAQQLGIRRETLSRWLGRDRPQPHQPATPPAATHADEQNTDTFSAWACHTFNFTRAEVELVKLAQAALDLAHDPTMSATVRLQASAQYRALVRDLKLPVSIEGEEDGHVQTIAQFPRRA